MLTVFTVALVITHQDTVGAVKATNFNPGKIIDDGVFYNKDAMSAAQIQDFLNRLVGNCDTWGTEPSEYGGGTRAQYAASRGWPGPPYVCINNYHENPDTGETSFEKGGGAFAGGVSAAQIIYTAAQNYSINPQVLLVMLKKESAGPLTADEWPMKSQYKYSMGYACPDSGPNNSASCDDTKSYLYKQVMLAAWQLKYYRDNPNSYRYAIGWNDIQYSPTVSCGTKRVYIENIATLSLYIYTPYTPNDGALANYPGTAPCGAYGNRNFFMFFSEWFGTTYGNSQIDMLKAAQEIKTTYDANKIALGNAITEIQPAFDSKPRVWQDFENGIIIWTHENGSHPVMRGSIFNRWKAIGGSAGDIGPPTSSAVTESSDGRTWQEFRKGTIIYSTSTGAWEIVPGPIQDKWRSTGGSLGTLGRPTSTTIVESNGNRKQTFEKGTLVRKDSSSPAYMISGDINTQWNNNKSVLGVPTGDSVTESNDGRIWQGFEKGTVIVPRPGEAWTIRSGKISDAWKLLGGSLGKLGRPVGNQFTESDGRIWQDFEKGTLIQKNANLNSYAVLDGSIKDRWRILGGSLGELGTPKMSPVTESDGRIWQDFENGTVIWSTESGAWEVQGGFYIYWKQNGGSNGRFGKPTSARTIESDGSRWQEYEKARLTWRTTGWTITPL
jgi:hypothetical protein